MLQQNDHYFYRGGSLVKEQTEGQTLLHFFYKSWLGRLLRMLLRRNIWSRVAGVYQNSRWSRGAIVPFVEKHGIKLDEFQVPLGGFTSFNDFFIRKLKPGVRVIDPCPAVITSPADSKLLVVADLSKDSHFFIKHVLLDLESFLKNKQLACEFEGGTLMIFRLAPYDYHRFHAPIAATATAPCRVGGLLESVNPIAYKAGVQPLLANERAVIAMRGSDGKKVLFIPVGATFVGAIHYVYTPGQLLAKGEEMGYFAFGGSTVALLFPKGCVQVEERFLTASRQNFEVEVKVGEAVAHWRS